MSRAHILFIAPLLVGCGGRLTSGDDGGPSDAGIVDGSSEHPDGYVCSPETPFGPPQNVSIDLPNGYTARDITIAADGTAWYAVDWNDNPRGIWTAQRVDDVTWSGAHQVWNTIADDIFGPSVSADGLVLFTEGGNGIRQSIRATTNDGFNIGTLITIPSDAASPGYDQDPYVLLNGLVLYYVKPYTPSSEPFPAVYRASRTSIQDSFSEAAHLAELDQSSPHSTPVVTQDELAIYYVARGNGPNIPLVATRGSANLPFGNVHEMTELQGIYELDYAYPVYVTPDNCRLYIAGVASHSTQGLVLVTR